MVIYHWVLKSWSVFKPFVSDFFLAFYRKSQCAISMMLLRIFVFLSSSLSTGRRVSVEVESRARARVKGVRPLGHRI